MDNQGELVGVPLFLRVHGLRFTTFMNHKHESYQQSLFNKNILYFCKLVFVAMTMT